MRSIWTLGVLLVLLGLHAATLNLPWYTYSHSSGRTLPPEYPGNETGENLTQHLYYPFALRGDVNASQAQDVQQETELLGLGVGLNIVLIAVAFGVELLWGHKDAARWPGMVLSLLGLSVTVALLAYVWFLFPQTLQEEGVRGTFTNRQVETGFIRSTLGWGWVVGGLAVLAHLTHFAFRYQQGSFDLGFIERYRRGA